MKIADKMTLVDDSFNVSMVDNGFVFEIGGRNEDGEWSRAKVIVTTIEDLLSLIKEAAELPRDN